MPLPAKLFSVVILLLFLASCAGTKTSNPVAGAYQFRIEQNITPTIPMTFQQAQNVLEVDGRYWKEDGHLMIEGSVQRTLSDLPGVDLVYTPEKEKEGALRFVEQLFSEVKRIPFDFQFLPGDRSPTLVNKEWETELLQATHKVGKPKGRYERLAENHLKAENLEAFAAAIAHAFPDDVYTKGEAWNSESEITLISQHRLSTVYTLKERKRNRDLVAVTSTLSPIDGDGTIRWNGMTFALEVTGTVSGDMVITRDAYPVIRSADLMQDLSATLRPVFSGMDNLPGMGVRIRGPLTLMTQAN